MLALFGLNQSEHYNALGYVIAERGRGSARAMTVWGLKLDGTSVHISEAESGSLAGLRCECGAGLVAKKGPKNAHHFAHESGGAVECRKAQLAALCRFTVYVLQRYEKLHLPPINAEALTTGFDEVWQETIHDCGGACLARGQGDNRRQLLVLCKTKRGQKMPSVDDFQNGNRSAIAIDLCRFRNLSDTELMHAVYQGADRVWLYNQRHLEASLTGEVPKLESKGTRRRLYAPPSTNVDWLAHEPANAPKMKSPSSISSEEWETLHWSELQQRFFGEKRSR